MAARKAFLKSLAADGGFQKENPSDAAQGVSQNTSSHVSFDLAGLLEFKGMTNTSAGYKRAPEPPRIRPNYDNSRRRLYADPEVRRQRLSCQFISIFLFSPPHLYFTLG